MATVILVEIVEHGEVVQTLTTSVFMKLCGDFFCKGARLFLNDYVDLFNKEFGIRKARISVEKI